MDSNNQFRYPGPWAILFSILIGIPLVVQCQGVVPDSCRLQIGTNLSGPADYGSEWPFVNIMPYARTWGTQNIVWVGGGQNPWDSQLAHTVDRDGSGYPLRVPFRAQGQDTLQIFYTVWANTESMPSGTYTCRYDGSGRIEFGFDGRNVEEAPGMVRFELDAGNGDILIMKILESKEGDHIRNIRIYLPGYDESLIQGPFEREWLEKLEPFSTVRFMDWGYTNNQEVEDWADRTRLHDYTFTQKTGVPYEYWIHLCNLTGKDPWICIPHRASDTFIDSLAILFKEKLDPGLTLYVEYTNEYWNWIFSQAHYVHDELDQSLPWPERYAPRLTHVLDRFSSHFDGEDAGRLVRVFATQHAWWDLGWRVMRQLESQGDLALIDAVSIAGYMGIYTDSLALLGASATAEDVLRLGRSLSFDPDQYAIRGWAEHARMAEQWDKQLLFYEGGQHFTPEPFGTEQPYGPALVEAQTHPGMYELYNDLLAHLRTLSEREMLFMNFSFISPTSERYGSWGVLTHQFDEHPPFSNAPKYRALLDNIPDCDLGTGIFREKGLYGIRVYPNPAIGELFVESATETDLTNAQIELFDITGKVMAIKSVPEGDRVRIELADQLRGHYILQIRTEQGILVFKVILL